MRYSIEPEDKKKRKNTERLGDWGDVERRGGLKRRGGTYKKKRKKDKGGVQLNNSSRSKWLFCQILGDRRESHWMKGKQWGE